MTIATIDTAQVAKLIRAKLKTDFAGHKFTVRISRYAGGSSIDVNWQDGPSVPAVEASIGHFKGATFDPSQDLLTNHTTTLEGPDGQKTVIRYGNDFLFTNREYSFQFMQRTAETVSQEYGRPYPPIFTGQDGHAYIRDDGEFCAPNATRYEDHMRQVILRRIFFTSGLSNL